VLWCRAVGLVGLLLAAVVAAAPAWLFSIREPLWQSALPIAGWALIVAYLVSRRIGIDPVGAFRLLRIGAAGLALLILLVAPPIVARRESGRAFFATAKDREVLAWGAWRTAWMAGYFYNDGRVREVASASEIMSALERGPVLVLAGPEQSRRLKAMGSVVVEVREPGPRRNELLEVERR
jgi:hypothetical protein